jgi:hypothetical protein
VEGVGKDYDSVAEASSRPVAIAPRDICMRNAMFKNMKLLSFILSCKSKWMCANESTCDGLI